MKGSKPFRQKSGSGVFADIMLSLLIVFMIITAILSERPEIKNAKESNLSVYITLSDQKPVFEFKKRHYYLQQLLFVVAAESSRQKRVRLVADANIKFGKLVSIKEAIERTRGVTTVETFLFE